MRVVADDGVPCPDTERFNGTRFDILLFFASYQEIPSSMQANISLFVCIFGEGRLAARGFCRCTGKAVAFFFFLVRPLKEEIDQSAVERPPKSAAQFQEFSCLRDVFYGMLCWVRVVSM